MVCMYTLREEILPGRCFPDLTRKLMCRHMSLDAARALAQGNIRPMQLLEILANRSRWGLIFALVL